MGILSSAGSFFRRQGRRIAAGLGQIFGLGFELTHRLPGLFGFFDYIFGWIGIRPKMKLYLRVVVLVEGGSPITTDLAAVYSIIDHAQSIFLSQANIDIVPVDGRFLEVSPYVAPAAALDVDCGIDLWEDDFGEAGEFFRMHSADMFLRSEIGYGTPITAFVVRTVRENGGIKRGCSMTLFADYLLVSLLGLNDPPSRVLAHELAHTCGLDILYHSSGNKNLMDITDLSGVNLTNFQKARIRNSPHVAYY